MLTRKLAGAILGIITIVTVEATVLGILKKKGLLDASGNPPATVPTTRQVATTAPLSGGGDLSADRTIALANQSANVVLSGPTSGGAAAPSFRALVAADIPNHSTTLLTSGTLPEVRGGTNQSTYARGDLLVASAANTLSKVTIGSANKVLHSDGTDATWQSLVAADIPNLAASKITSGQVALAQGGTGVDGTSAAQNAVFAGPSGSSGSASFRALAASDLPNHSAALLTSGLVATTQGGTGLDTSGNVDGQILIGKTSTHAFALATITGTANRVTVTNGANTITLSGPQDLASGSSPTFSALTLSSGLTLTGATITGAPTWSSSQGITLSTASQPNVTSVGTLAGLTMTGTLSMSSTPVISGSPACTLGATTVTTLGTAGNVTLTDGNNFVVGTSSGTKIGTATTQKLGFYNATPIVQISGSTDILAAEVSLGLRAASSNPPLNMGTGSLTAGTGAFSGSLTTGLAGTGTGSLVINGTTSGSTTITVAAAAGSPATWTLPTATAAAGAALTDVAGNGTLSWVVPSAGSSSVGLEAGDGSDGSLTYDGSTTILGMAPSSNIYTLTRSIFPSSMTVNSGVTIKTANFIILCSGTLTNNGTISNNGGSASTSTGGSNPAAGFFSVAANGANGITTATTSAAGANGVNYTGGGGGGGLSGGTQNSNGTSATVSDASNVFARAGRFGYPASNASSGSSWQAIGNATASNGGRGSGDGTNAGGGAGAGGDVLYVVAKTITCGASVQFNANGGTGGNGTAGTAGGGGGGGGGVVLLYATSYTGTALVSGTNATANGGTGGTGSTTAGSGQNGLAGQVYIVTIK